MNTTFFETAWISLKICMEEPYHWWRLCLDGHAIKRASFFNSVCQRFSHSHRTQLREQLSELLQRAVPTTEEQKIILEKIETLMQSPNIWFFELLPSKQVPLVWSHAQVAFSLKPIESKGVFYNEEGEAIWKQLGETLRRMFPRTLKSFSQRDLKTWNREPWVPKARSAAPQVTWIGHATLLLQVAGFNLLFDPGFHFVFPCFRRHTPPGIALDALPKIDILGISHNHGDHCERIALRKLMPYQPFAFVPDKLDCKLKKMGYQKTEGKKWGEQLIFTRGEKTLTLTAVPAKHSSQTSLFDLNCSHWMGMLIEAEGMKLYFCGDTGYKEEIFQEIKRVFGIVDVAFLPIAPDEEAAMHMNHADALRAFRLLEAKVMIPIHWGSYRMGDEQLEEPLHHLLKLAAQNPALQGKIYSPKLGETLSLTNF